MGVGAGREADGRRKERESCRLEGARGGVGGWDWGWID